MQRRNAWTEVAFEPLVLARTPVGDGAVPRAAGEGAPSLVGDAVRGAVGAHLRTSSASASLSRRPTAAIALSRPLSAGHAPCRDATPSGM